MILLRLVYWKIKDIINSFKDTINKDTKAWTWPPIITANKPVVIFCEINPMARRPIINGLTLQKYAKTHVAKNNVKSTGISWRNHGNKLNTKYQIISTLASIFAKTDFGLP